MTGNLADKNYFPQLTGLRAIAAYLVFLVHIIPNKDHSKNNFIENLCATGYLGVSIFFVLSGFLICYRYRGNFELNFNWFKGYMINRIARIYPMYFILTVATFVYNHYFHINAIDKIVLFLNLTFLKGYFDGLHFTGISQGWSLTVEETFYFLAPFIFLILPKKGSLILLTIISLSIGLILVSVFKDIDFYGFMNNFKFMFNFTFFGRCIEFFLGIQLALIMKKNMQSKDQSVSKVPVKTLAGSVTMIAGLIALTVINDYWSNFPQPNLAVFIINNVFFPIAVFYFIYGLITERSMISYFLSLKLMEILGKSSYAFYLIHIGFISYFVSRQFHLNTISLFISLNLISVALFYFIESPLNKGIRKFGKLKMAN